MGCPEVEAARAPSRQVWLGGLSQALIRACPPREWRREGAERIGSRIRPLACGGKGCVCVGGGGGPAGAEGLTNRPPRPWSALAACGARAAGIGREQLCRSGWAAPPP